MDFLRHNEFNNRNFWILLLLHLVLGVLYVFLGMQDILFVAFAFILLMLTMLSLDLLSAILSALSLITILELNHILNEDTNSLSFSTILVLALLLISATLMGASFIARRSMTTKKLDQEIMIASLERHRLRSLINSMADGVIATDAQGNVVVYNGASLDIMNINVSLEQQNLSNFLKLIDKDNQPINIFALAEEKKSQLVTRDYRLQIDEEEFINLYVSISPVKIGYGQDGQQGYIILMRDITREKSLEEERDEFISVVSHELRTPVTITEGNISNAQLILKRNDIAVPEVDETIEAAHKQIVFLADMINDLSTLSRAERGVIQFDPEEINVKELIQSLLNDYKIDTEQKDLVLRSTIQGDVGTLISSRLYVREVLQNFITNAIKYTQKGSITISVANRADGNGIDFSVRDSGIGISLADQKQLFKKFFRSEDFRTRENNGTGLGLYVTNKLASMIKAEISVSSELNRGSTFTVSVPNLKLHHKHHES